MHVCFESVFCKLVQKKKAINYRLSIKIKLIPLKKQEEYFFIIIHFLYLYVIKIWEVLVLDLLKLCQHFVEKMGQDLYNIKLHGFLVCPFYSFIFFTWKFLTYLSLQIEQRIFWPSASRTWKAAIFCKQNSGFYWQFAWFSASRYVSEWYWPWYFRRTWKTD